ncbi:creatininase family protein [Bacillus sp. 31A1R]|uniref:Creatininase family protein n=1 Tax=Robertmurraya mangrovi TaxID=3098077 RepID=A0ABU5IW11_9BACI|nr:creatininase family protein [Bacillus sp. 31A1R]MDZ5471326.1 creatininase family protein [Bacillus sp. 31A1R]
MYMMDLNLRQFEEALQSGVDTVILPIGMVEAHGPHCSLGTDVLIPREFLRRINERINEKVMIGAEVAYGHSWALQSFGGTIDVSAEAFSNYVFEIGKEFYRQGFENIVLFNGHGGNIAALNIIAEKLADLGMTVLTLNWWIDYRDTIKTITPEPGHAGEDETSLVLAISESLAETDGVGNHEITISPKLKYKNFGKEIFPDGYLGNAGTATADKGEKLYEALVPLMLQDMEEMWNVKKN